VLAQGWLTLPVVWLGLAHFQLPVWPPKSPSLPTGENPGRPWGAVREIPLVGASVFIAQKHDNLTTPLRPLSDLSPSLHGTSLISSVLPSRLSRRRLSHQAFLAISLPLQEGGGPKKHSNGSLSGRGSRKDRARMQNLTIPARSRQRRVDLLSGCGHDALTSP